jgi:hypothetical protein
MKRTKKVVGNNNVPMEEKKSLDQAILNLIQEA